VSLRQSQHAHNASRRSRRRCTNQDLSEWLRSVNSAKTCTTVECFPDLSAATARKEKPISRTREISFNSCSLDGQIDRIGSSGNHASLSPSWPQHSRAQKLHRAWVILSNDGSLNPRLSKAISHWSPNFKTPPSKQVRREILAACQRAIGTRRSEEQLPTRLKAHHPVLTR